MGASPVGTVSAIRRYPVKSMLGEALDAGSFDRRGLAGDRAYALVDHETSKVISVKRPKRWGRMFELAARSTPSGVEVTLPDGQSLSIDDPELVVRLSDLFGREVSVATTPPPNASFEEAWVRELKDGVGTYFERPTRLEDGDELVEAGLFMSERNNFFNLGAVHLVTTGTTRRLTELAPGSRFDPHRFRPNIVVDTDELGFVETEWRGRELTIGGVRLTVTMTVPRCVMTTLQQGDDLPADPDVLRAITEHNRVDALGTGTSYPCVGVYADVVEDGAIRVGDEVLLG